MTLPVDGCNMRFYLSGVHEMRRTTIVQKRKSVLSEDDEVLKFQIRLSSIWEAFYR